MHAAPEPGSLPPAGAAGLQPRLQIRDLQHTYSNGVRALAGVDLDVPRGMYGLLGPNGAGKSTLMRIVATLQQPSAGSITFDGADILADPFAIRRKICSTTSRCSRVSAPPR
jgi:ABC-type multidrug transport system ATPase subunit